LVFLLALTAGDYLLWDWSIADGHDVVSLVAGLMLLPLAAVSFGRLVLATGRLLRLVIGGAKTPTSTGRVSREDVESERQPQDPVTQSNSPSGKLAA
jgi:hypothetical protein